MLASGELVHFQGVGVGGGCVESIKVFFLFSSIKGSSLGSKFFLFRESPFSEGNWCAGEQTGIHKICLPWKMAEKSTKHIQCPLLVPYLIRDSLLSRISIGYDANEIRLVITCLFKW